MTFLRNVAFVWDWMIFMLYGIWGCNIFVEKREAVWESFEPVMFNSLRRNKFGELGCFFHEMNNFRKRDMFVERNVVV